MGEIITLSFYLRDLDEIEKHPDKFVEDISNRIEPHPSIARQFALHDHPPERYFHIKVQKRGLPSIDKAIYIKLGGQVFEMDRCHKPNLEKHSDIYKETLDYIKSELDYLTKTYNNYKRELKKE